MVDDVLFSSRDDDWETPQDLFDRLNAVFDFQLDAAASATNAKCARHFTKDDDALAQDWSAYRRVWLNPPYGRALPGFLKKAYGESRQDCIVVCLVPSRTDTRWWHDWVQGKAAAWFIKGRLRFGRPGPRAQGARHGSPFPSAILVYGLDLDRVLNPDDGRDDGGLRSADGAGAGAVRRPRGDPRRARQRVRTIA